jgi:hypothetical protein
MVIFIIKRFFFFFNGPPKHDSGAQRVISGPLQRSGRNVPREAGMTGVGILILSVFIGLFAFATIQLTPIYLNYMKVAGVLDGVYKEFDSQNPTRGTIQRSIQRRFDVESVSKLTASDIKVTVADGGFRVTADYDDTSPFISNVYFTVKFDKSVLIRR